MVGCALIRAPASSRRAPQESDTLDSRDQERIAEATRLALGWHADQKRKGTTIPYVSHLLQVTGLVIEFGGDADQAIAGLLHDSLEDAPDAATRADRERIVRDRFGQPVLDLVLDCTDTGADEAEASKRPWKERKRDFVEAVSKAPGRSLLVIACDKLHSLRSLILDIQTHGPETLDRFNAPPEEQLWLFGLLHAEFRDRVPPPLYEELERLTDRYRVLARPTRA